MLIIEDNPSTLAITAMLLRLDNCDVHTAQTGEEGVALGLSRSFDAVLIDFGLPGISGAEVVRRLKDQGVRARLVLMTAFPTFEFSLEAADSGADACVGGPLWGDELVQLVRRTLSGPPAIRIEDSTPVPTPAARRVNIDPRIREVIRIINRDLVADLSVAGLAASVALSPSRLRHLFLAVTGINLSRFIVAWRLAFVARRLSTTFEHIRQIAFQAGWLDLRQFRKQFRERYGMPPKEYRCRCPRPISDRQHRL